MTGDGTTIGEMAKAGILEFGDGYRTKRSELGQPGFRIIRVADVSDGAISLDGQDFVSADMRAKIGPKLAAPGDIILTTKGTVGRVAIMPQHQEPAVYSPQVCYFRVREDANVNPRFLAYWLKSDEFVRQASYRQNNTDMAAYISLADLRSVEISLPSIRDQQAIAEVLGALDDKIAANTKLAQTADDLASALFAKATMNSALSETTYDEVGRVGGGGTPKTRVSDYWDGDINWATPTDVTNLPGPYLSRTTRHITQAGLDSCASPLYPPSSILMTSRATIGAFALAEVPTAVNQGFIVLVPHDGELGWWLFHEMRSRVPEFLAHSNGATFMELSRRSFKSLRVRLGDAATMREFGDIAGSLHRRAQAALHENNTLAELRNTLLPPLMSGRLRVKDAEKTVGDVV